jgi:hypothetical protein
LKILVLRVILTRPLIVFAAKQKSRALRLTGERGSFGLIYGIVGLSLVVGFHLRLAMRGFAGYCLTEIMRGV